jgi:hypothetical protein
VRSNWNTSGSETRKPMKATMFAHQRTAAVFDEGIRKRISVPTMGVNRTI